MKKKYEKRYLIAYTKTSTRDIQVTNQIDPCKICSQEPCKNGECPTPNREWKDFNGQVVLGFYRGINRADAIFKAAIAVDCSVNNLVAYELK